MLGPDTATVNGQMVSVRDQSAYIPTVMGVIRSVGPTPLPSIPPAYAVGGSVGSSGSGYDPGVAAASQNPWSWSVSPLPWALLFLFVGILGLRYIHWRH